MPQFTKNNFSWSCNLVAEYFGWHTQVISLGSKHPYPAEPSCQPLCQLLNAAVKKHTKSLVLRQKYGGGGTRNNNNHKLAFFQGRTNQITRGKKQQKNATQQFSHQD